MKKFFNSIINLVRNFFVHWNKPGDNNYVSSKELVAYSVGGMGVNFVAAVAGQIILASSCLLLGSVYGMKPTSLATILLVNTIFTLAIQPLKSWIIDNTRTKAGKIKPYILWLSFPSAILITVMAYLPYETMTSNQLTLTVGAIFIAMNFIFQFYFGMYTQLPQLMTPNSDERAVIYSFSSIVFSLAPTITGAIFPLIANIFDKGLFDQNFYKVIFPVFGFLGAALSLLAYFGSKERVILPKTYKQKVGFIDGLKKIAKYRYFWILNGAGVVVFARGAITATMAWTYTYMLQNNVVYSILTLLMGTSSLFGMLLGPVLCKSIGKRNVNIISDIAFAAASVVLIFFNNSVVIMCLMMYIMFGASAIQLITLPAMNGDALDFLQLKTGERLEGTVGNFGIITGLIALGTNYVIPFINEYYGLVDNYDVLYDSAIRIPMFRALAILSVVGAIAHAAIFIPYDLSEKKHALIIEELKAIARIKNEEAGYKDASVLQSDENLAAAAIKEDLLSEAIVEIGDEVGVDLNKVKEDDNKDEDNK